MNIVASVYRIAFLYYFYYFVMKYQQQTNENVYFAMRHTFHTRHLQCKLKANLIYMSGLLCNKSVLEIVDWRMWPRYVINMNTYSGGSRISEKFGEHKSKSSNGQITQPLWVTNLEFYSYYFYICVERGVDVLGLPSTCKYSTNMYYPGSKYYFHFMLQKGCRWIQLIIGSLAV